MKRRTSVLVKTCGVALLTGSVGISAYHWVADHMTAREIAFEARWYLAIVALVFLVWGSCSRRIAAAQDALTMGLEVNTQNREDANT